MILDVNVTTSYEINNLSDLGKLNSLMESEYFKPNVSKIARELECDRRTAKKYINGFEKSKTRSKSSKIDDYYDDIKEILDNKDIKCTYISFLYRYMVDNKGLDVSESNFRRYIRQHDELNNSFKKNRANSKPNNTESRFETDMGEQAQLDWKETMEFKLICGEIIIINVFVLLLGYSRFRVSRLSLTKTRDILFHFLDQAFEVFGGVPKTLLTDNMKTVMDTSRTKYSSGKINDEFSQFADDYGFETKPCVGGRANTKGKVEATMKMMDELLMYNGQLDYNGLVKKVEEINNRENMRYHKSYQKIPFKHLKKEKDFLLPLPPKQIRSHYQITTKDYKVNNSCMISFKNNLYSLPLEYKNKVIQLQEYDNQIHIYFNTKLICIHKISNNNINYLKDHYTQVLSNSMPFKKDDEIEKMAIENIRKLSNI